MTIRIIIFDNMIKDSGKFNSVRRTILRIKILFNMPEVYTLLKFSEVMILSVHVP